MSDTAVADVLFGGIAVGLSLGMLHDGGAVFFAFAESRPISFLLIVFTVSVAANWSIAHFYWPRGLGYQPLEQARPTNGIARGAAQFASGAITLSYYLVDLATDILVAGLLWSTHNYAWASLSTFLLLWAPLVMYLRVLPYLSSTFGADSWIFRCFLWWGFPWGLLFLDGLMALELLFGAFFLRTWPFPAWVKQFLPAYSGSRLINEIFCESAPQALLQGFVYVAVASSCGAAAPDSSSCGSSFAALWGSYVQLLPLSILVSALHFSKHWFGLVHSARASGMSVRAKGLQLWNVGAGLPLDALRKSTIVEWRCPYKLDASEVQPLLDALSKNDSLVLLNLAHSGVGFCPGAAGAPLLEAMARGPVLPRLERLMLTEGALTPVDEVRRLGSAAVRAELC